MTTITLDDLRRIMRESAGADESVDLDGDIAAVPFEDLGYDSLALLEMSAVVRQEFDVVAKLAASAAAVDPELTLPPGLTAVSGPALKSAPAPDRANWSSRSSGS